MSMGVGVGMLVAILAVAVWASCATDAPAGVPDGTKPIAEYFNGDRDLDVGSCPGAPAPLDVNGAVAVKLYRGPGVTDADLVKTTSRIDRFFSRYGISFSVTSPPSQVWDRTIIGGSVTEMEEALAEADVDASSIEGRLISAGIVYDDLRAFLAMHALPGRPWINIVLLDDIARVDSVALSIVGDLAGLAFSPGLVQTAKDREPILVDVLGIDGDFTPTVFLSVSRLRRMLDPEATAVVAHDVAHAMGLSHDPRTWNLMYEGLISCLPGLAPDQVEQIKSSRAVDTNRMEF